MVATNFGYDEKSTQQNEGGVFLLVTPSDNQVWGILSFNEAICMKRWRFLLFIY